MSGKISPLPPELDRLVDGWLSLTSWSLAQLAAAGVTLSEGAEDRADLGTDRAGVQAAERQLTEAGLLPLPARGSSAGDPRGAELAFFHHGYAGAPGAVTLVLTTDLGPDGAGARLVHVDLFPARTAAGEVVVGALLIDPNRPHALAAVATIPRTADALAWHLLTHGQKDEPGDIASGTVLALRARPFGQGFSTTVTKLTLIREAGHVQVTSQHGLRASGQPDLAPAALGPFLADLIAETVS